MTAFITASRPSTREVETRLFTMFNQKVDISLIRLVKSHPVLYDFNDAKYMDFNAREVAWQKIGDELKKPAADCKVRWIHIRDVNRRILKKTVSVTGKKVKMYKYENELAFMRPFYKDVLGQNDDYNEFDDDDNDNVNDNQQIEQVDYAVESEESDHKPVIKKKRKQKSSSKKKRKVVENDEPEASTFDNVTPSELDPADPIDAFLLSVRATMKGFSPYHQNLAKSRIFAMVQEHELQQIQEHNGAHDVKISSSTYLLE